MKIYSRKKKIKTLIHIQIIHMDTDRSLWPSMDTKPYL
jgi:hypothetical protein